MLSGVRAKEGEQMSLLHRIGNEGILVISDFTVIMSKGDESRTAILSQFRLLYDGEMIKNSGSSKNAIRWPAKPGVKGYLGVLAGSTPSIYSKFEEVADMGERFIYYRMREIDAIKATRLAMNRAVYGRELDELLSEKYAEYIKEVVRGVDVRKIVIPDAVNERIIEVATFAERVRTVAHQDWRQEVINRIPVPALPMRVALQLKAIVKGLGAIRLHETGKCDFGKEELSMIDWIGYSLANEEKRGCLKVLASVPFDNYIKTSMVADYIGLDTKVVKIILQNLAAVGILERSGMSDSLMWKFKTQSDYNVARRIEHIKEDLELFDRERSSEEEKETEDDAGLEALVEEFNNIKTD